MSSSEKIKSFLLTHIPKHDSDIVTFAAKHFRTSRQNVHRYLTQLISSGKVIKTGTRRGTRYFLAAKQKVVFRLPVTMDLQEDVVWTKYLEKRLEVFPENVQRICQYGFTEMLNNVIDHSSASKVEFGVMHEKGRLDLWLLDNGVGVFEKIRAAFGLSDHREAILHLSKGKLTTDPSRHSGEGIFFTSRAFDVFYLSSNRLRFMRHDDDDWLFEASEQAKGTFVSMVIKSDSKRELKSVFDRYSDTDTHKFDKTHVVVELSKLGSESYISRSQAKRVLVGLEKFHEVMLDFRNVKAVGQGFVDEIFRVFKNTHPEVKIRYMNTNPDVLFMLERSI